MKNKINLTEGNIWKQLILFCIPIMIGTLFQQLYNAVDVIIVGKFIGTDAIASVGGSTGIITQMAVGLFIGLSSGVTVVISKLVGANDQQKIKSGIQNAIILSIIIGLLFTIIGLTFSNTFLYLLHTPVNINKDSLIYLRIYFSGIIFVCIYNIGSSILRALGDSKKPLYFLIICCFLNIILDLFFVTVLSLGVAGVAIATVFAQTISAVLILFALNQSVPNVYKQFQINIPIILDIIRIGLPAALQSLMNSLSGIVMASAINELGSIAVAGNTVYAKLDSIFWMISNGFSISVTTFVSQNIGANKLDRMKRGIWICLGMDIIVSGCLSLFFLSCSSLLFYIFTDDLEVISCGRQVMKAIAPFYVLVSFYEITGSSLRGMGKIIFPTTINIIGLCGIRIVWIMVVINKISSFKTLYGIILSCPISWIFTAIFTMLYFIFILQKQNQ